MPRPRTIKPKYCHHTASGRAFVVIDGKFIYLGKHGTQESRDRYDRAIGEWIARGRLPVPEPPSVDGSGGPTVDDVIASFWEQAKQQYPTPPYEEGKRPSGELGNYWDALRPLRRLYGPTIAADFGPKALKVVREEMVRLGWSRNYLNRNIGRIKHVFSCAVENELLPAEVYYRLKAVPGLRRGQSGARENEPVKPPLVGSVEAMLPFLSPQVRAMAEVQQLTGMRPTELCMMRGCDIDMSGDVWVYRPRTHKTAHHGQQRLVVIGPEAMMRLRPFLRADVEAFLFSPSKAKQQPSQTDAPEGKRRPKEHYTRDSYRRAVTRACERAFPAPAELPPEQLKLWKKQHWWYPHKLRHAFGTRVRHDYGLEAAQVLLSHKTLSSTQVYAERNEEIGKKVMKLIG